MDRTSANHIHDATTQRRLGHTLEIDGADPGRLRVHAFRGHEGLSQLFRFDIVASSSLEDVATVAEDYLGKAATLTIRTGDVERQVHGVIGAVRARPSMLDRAGRRRAQVVLRLVPRLGLLRLKRRSRVFQEKRIEDIVGTVLRDAGIASRWLLAGVEPVREYCTQFEETDLAFVQRLCAEAAYVFRLDAGDSTESVTFGDDTRIYDGEPWLVQYRDTDGDLASSLSWVSAFESRARLANNAFSYREYDPGRPLSPVLSTARSGGREELTGDLEDYEHHGVFGFPKWDHDVREAGRMLRQRRRRARTVQGRGGTCQRV